MKELYVTRPSLPKLNDLVQKLDQIWESKVLTNGGAFHAELEQRLCKHLGVENISLFNNGTVALLVALKALEIKGEVITTPYSFVATAHSILWNDLTPVFCDIDPVSLNLDPAKVESLITPKTSAIMPVHCYGYPCDVHAIEKLATRNKLKIVYDAAHAFAVRMLDESILSYGDLSVLSFHATKVFNTFEGGAIVCRSREMKERIDKLKNFGFENETTVTAVGINGKMSELNAAIGLLQLQGVNDAILSRKSASDYYRNRLQNIDGIRVHPEPYGVEQNYSYFPIFITPEFPVSRDELYFKLREKGVFARRYFYPLITSFHMYAGLPSVAQKSFPVAERAANEVLCLPIYENMDILDQDRVLEVISMAKLHA